MLSSVSWTELLRQTLTGYDEVLMRGVAGKLVKPRSQWPVEELIDRSIATIGNPPVVDRRLEELPPAAGKVLAIIGYSRQPRWRLGSLLELLAALGHADGVQPIFALFEAGLLYPEFNQSNGEHTNGQPILKSFEQWLGQGGVTGYMVFAHPQVCERARQRIDLGLTECPGIVETAQPAREADGLEWFLRLATLWQQVIAAPVRRTVQGDFFKRDLERMRKDPLLTTSPADSLAELPDPAMLTVALAELEGLIRTTEGELRAGDPPAAWADGLYDALASLWASLPLLDAWEPLEGWRGGQPGTTPFPAACLLAHLLLLRLPEGAWADPNEVESWIHEHHPYWAGESVRPSRRRSWLTSVLLGVSYQLRFVQATKGPEGNWLVRLSPLGRWLLGQAERPQTAPAFVQTLLVQPNLEIIAYRQGLTPALIGHLARIATFKNLGAACTLQLGPETVYRALQSGETYESVVQMLEQHGMRPTPTAVLDSLRTWANKHERITIFPAATLFEFGSAEELNEAFARGLPATRLSDQLALVANEQGVDFRHFRLAGTRDYALPPEKCIVVDADGVTLTVDLSRSDLMLDIELRQFAELIDHGGVTGKRLYRLTPTSLSAARDSGLTMKSMEEWFRQRAGQPISPAARFLLGGSQLSPPMLRRHLVIHVGSPDLADGLVQWPGTRALIDERLGPTTLAVAEEHLDTLRERLASVGIHIGPLA